MSEKQHIQNELWPALPWQDWQETCVTIHMWSQIIGKIRLALAPMVNHWWQVPLYLTARGLTTSPMPYNSRIFQMDFDFLDHELQISTDWGSKLAVPLQGLSVAAFYGETMAALRSLGIEVHIWTTPVEVPERIPFERDTQHASYDPEVCPSGSGGCWYNRTGCSKNSGPGFWARSARCISSGEPLIWR